VSIRAVLKNLRKYGENGSNILQGRRLLYNENISARISSFKESFYERRAQRPNFLPFSRLMASEKGGGVKLFCCPPEKWADPHRMMASEKGGGGHPLGAKLEKTFSHVACEFTL